MGIAKGLPRGYKREFSGVVGWGGGCPAADKCKPQLRNDGKGTLLCGPGVVLVLETENWLPTTTLALATSHLVVASTGKSTLWLGSCWWRLYFVQYSTVRSTECNGRTGTCRCSRLLQPKVGDGRLGDETHLPPYSWMCGKTKSIVIAALLRSIAEPSWS